MWMIILAVVVSGALGAVTDWLLMGVLFHDAYDRYPEVWRPGIRDGKDRGPVVWSSLIGYVMTGGVVTLCLVARVDSIEGGLVVALLAWVAGPLIVTVINGMFIKLDPKITIAHCAGYLARVLLAGVAAGIALG
jgi:hypothetical protein